MRGRRRRKKGSELLSRQEMRRTPSRWGTLLVRIGGVILAVAAVVKSDVVWCSHRDPLSARTLKNIYLHTADGGLRAALIVPLDFCCSMLGVAKLCEKKRELEVGAATREAASRERAVEEQLKRLPEHQQQLLQVGVVNFFPFEVVLGNPVCCFSLH